MARPSPAELAFPGWKWSPARARRHYLAAGALTALAWVSIVSLVLLPPASPLVPLALAFLPAAGALALLLTWRGVHIARSQVIERFGNAP